MNNQAVKCEFCECSGTFIHDNVGIVFECEGVLSKPTICDLKRQRAFYQVKHNGAIKEQQQARDCDRAYFSWLVKDHATMINNITKMIEMAEEMKTETRYCEGCGIVGWRGFKCNCTPQEKVLKEGEQ